MKEIIYNFYIQGFNKKRNYKVNPDEVLSELLKTQYLDRKEMEVFQLKKINKLLVEARSNNSFYKSFHKGYEEPFDSLKHFLNGIPKLTKEDVMNNNLLNPEEPNRFRHSTSGSTGDPMVVEISWLAEVYRSATMMRFLNWWGVKLNDRNILVWAVPKKSKNRLWGNIKNWMRNRIHISVFDLNEGTINGYFEKIKKHGPVYIRGYKSGVYQLAQLMNEKNLKLEKGKLKVIFVTSEVLYEDERKFIEKVFDCKVANEYGSAEAGYYAVECPHGSMHINDDVVLISSDKEGQAIVTELNNNGMPLINYVNNDKVLISEKHCSCGRSLRIIDHVEGRSIDMIVCQDGSEKSPFILYYIFKEIYAGDYPDSIKKYKITQDRLNFKVEIIPDVNYRKDILPIIASRFREEIGENIIVDFQIVQSIEREKSGKLRSFIRTN